MSHRIPALPVLVLGSALLSMGPSARAQGRQGAPAMRVYETPYYIMHTDLGEADAREADLRMTRMYEEYKQQTSSFAGQFKGKLPFYLYRNPADYYAAGAPQGSAGVYMEMGDDKKLMAIAGAHTTAGTWHVVQHEGFHQFVSAAIRGAVPIWANEGLAEYFGESQWTGDGFVMGLIPPERLKEIKEMIKGGKFKPFKELMAMSDQEWGNRLEYSNYNEAWAMVHFLAHAENGRYRPAFASYMQMISRGSDGQSAWNKVFGNDTKAFESRFAAWWMNLPEEPTRSGYVQALVATETSYLARATLLKKSFPSAEEFFKNYTPPDVAVNRDFWLPPNLFKEMSTTALRVGDWSMQNGAHPQLICVDQGVKFTGTFVLNGTKVAKVTVNVQGTPLAAPAR